MQKLSNKSDEYYWTKLKNFIVDELSYFDSRKGNHKLEGNLLIQASKQLEEFYLLTKFRYTCEIKTRNYVYAEDLNEISSYYVDQLTEKYCQNNSTIRAFAVLSDLLEYQSKKIYLNFKEILFKSEIPDKQLHLSFLMYAANFSANQIRINEKYYTKEALEIYQFSLDSKIIIANGIFPEIPFKNIVNLYCYFNDIKGVLNFIDKWNVYLPTQSRISMTSLCKARVLFNQKEYLESLDALSSCKFEDSYCEIEARILKVRLLYEVNKMEEAFQICYSLESYIRRNKKLSPSHRKGSLNFAKITRRIINKKKKESLLKTLDKANSIICSSWLRDKINTLNS